MLPVRRGNPKALVSGDACPWSDRLYAAFAKFTMCRVVILAQGKIWRSVFIIIVVQSEEMPIRCHR